ncbi:hypothetical protein BS17DRAFT_217452 [Gyrodon lividus]|nr:hypothetical protein BS17DRAFT_217452 [Gyrodon lividus]
MATAYIEYRPAQNNYAVIPAGAPLRQSGQMRTGVAAQADYSLQTTLQALTDTARDLPAEKALCDEIETLCRATLAIDQAFYEIGQRLSQATNEQQKRVELYETCRDLETRWNQHHETYKQLLWRSRQVAGEAQCAVDDFCEVFLPCLCDPDVTLAERRQLVRDQIEELEDRSNTSQGLTQEFLNFGRTLDTYIADFDRAVEGLGRGEQTERVRVLKERLRPAKAAMDAVSEEVKELGWKFAGDVVMTGIAVLLSIVAPTWWEKLSGTVVIGIDAFNAKNSGIRFLEALRRRELVVKEYKAIKNEYDLEQACLSQMVKLESTLHDSRPVVHDVTTKLGAFANVWAAISADIRTIKNALSYAENPSSKLFVRRVQRLEKLYGYLSRALRHYQVTVRLPESRAGGDEEKVS